MAKVFCFTSTGNSLYAAKKIAAQIGGDVVAMNGVSLDSPEPFVDDVIGFVYPVYFWGLPRMVERFVSQQRIENKDAYIFAVATYGGAAPGVNGRLNELLKPQGVCLTYGAKLKCADNYLPYYQAKDSEAIRQRIDADISKIAGAVKNREPNRVQAYTIINKLVHRSLPADSSDRGFSVSPACTGCATCIKICPAANIEMREGKPVFLGECEHCLACLQNCPAHAIDWKDKTQGKERYRQFSVTVDDLVSFNSK